MSERHAMSFSLSFLLNSTFFWVNSYALFQRENNNIAIANIFFFFLFTITVKGFFYIIIALYFYNFYPFKQLCRILCTFSCCILVRACFFHFSYYFVVSFVAPCFFSMLWGTFLKRFFFYFFRKKIFHVTYYNVPAVGCVSSVKQTQYMRWSERRDDDKRLFPYFFLLFSSTRLSLSRIFRLILNNVRLFIIKIRRKKYGIG